MSGIVTFEEVDGIIEFGNHGETSWDVSNCEVL